VSIIMMLTPRASQVTASSAAAAVLQNNAATMSVVRYFIPARSYHFVIAMWRAKE